MRAANLSAGPFFERKEKRKIAVKKKVKELKLQDRHWRYVFYNNSEKDSFQKGNYIRTLP